MARILEVTPNEIEMLSDEQLTQTLSMLLYHDATEKGIPHSSVSASLRLETPDGGADAIVRWAGEPVRTSWIPKTPTLFQCKATPMGPKACGEEVLTTDQSALKSMVLKNLDENGAYVLFYSKMCNDRQNEEKIAAIRGAYQSVHHKNAATAPIEIYDANKIAQWVNTSLAIIRRVAVFAKRNLPDGIISWDDWKEYSENLNEFVSDEVQLAFRRQIREYVSEPRKVCRITGLSGIGKTRLVFESFRPTTAENSHDPDTEYQKVVYLDASEVPNLPSVVNSWRTECRTGTVVADNCELELHHKLLREVTHASSNLSLVTMDYHPETTSGEHPFIELRPVSDTVIEGIIRSAYPDISKADVSRIAEFAQGFPRIAVLLCKARLRDEEDIGTLKDPLLIKKLLWGRGEEDPIAMKVITGASLFDYFGLLEDVANQRQFIAEEICGVSADSFYAACIDFAKKGIIDIRHRFARVVPRPLAIRLAADWWEHCPPDKAIDLFLNKLPTEMAEPFCDQMSKLQFLPRAKEIVAQLCGETAPFGNAEVINTDRGSRLFRAFVEVNPEATAKALHRAFADLTKGQLQNIGPGRRNLVWALEKLCYWREGFPESWKVLHRLAVAENETWSNNSTGLFLQLFHVFLSGTEIEPKERLDFIIKLLANRKEEELPLAISALGSALLTHHFTRMGGVEKQGTRPTLEDWKPKDWTEVHEYWNDCIGLLRPFLVRKDELGETSRKQIAENVSGLIEHGLLSTIEKVALEVVQETSGGWPELVKSLERQINYRSEGMPEKISQRIQDLVVAMQPKDLFKKLQVFVTNPDWIHKKSEGGDFIDIAEQRSREFARELADKQSDLLRAVPVISQGEQRQALSFGSEIAKSIGYDSNFIESCINALTDEHNEQPNPSLVCGYLRELQPKHSAKIVDLLKNLSINESSANLAFDLIRSQKLSLELLDLMLSMLDKGWVDVKNFRSLAYGSVMSVLSAEQALEFLERLSKHGNDATTISFDIAFMYCFGNKGTFRTFAKFFRSILIDIQILGTKDDTRQSMDAYHLEEIIGTLLKEGTDKELAQHVAQSIVNFCKTDRIYRSDLSVRKITAQLLDNFLEVVWPIFGNAFVSQEWQVRFNMSHIFGAKGAFEDDAVDLFAKIPNNILLDWMKNCVPLAPSMVAENIVLFTKQTQETAERLTEKAMLIFDNFSGNQDVLNAVYGNLVSFGSVGSRVPYYQIRARVLEPLLSHNSSQVKEWAQKAISRMNLAAKNEQKDDEERQFTKL